MVQEIYKNSLSLFIPVGQIAVEKLSIENPAKHLIKTGRRLFASAKKEYDFGKTAETLAESQTESKNCEHLHEIAGWHFQRAVEHLESAASYFKRAEQCASSAKYRKYARIQHGRCLQETRNYRNGNAVAAGFFSLENLSKRMRFSRFKRLRANLSKARVKRTIKPIGAEDCRKQAITESKSHRHAETQPIV